jgi:predicted small lipoprotein YifL
MRPVLFLCIVLLWGCGQRGSLYLPEEETRELAEQPAAAEDATATTEDSGTEDEREGSDDDGPANP